MRGTLLNTATVAAGSLAGLALGSHIPAAYEQVALQGIGLVVIGMGLKMFLESRKVLVVAASVALGGCLGMALRFQEGLDAFSRWAQGLVGAGHGGSSSFSAGLVLASIVFCVGPLTVVGCIHDGLDGNIELLALKSTLDGIASFFFAAAFGLGVVFSAGVVLVLQGALTLASKPLAPVAKNRALLAELTGAGGVVLSAVGLKLLGILNMPVVDYLPALAFAPLLASWASRLPKLFGSEAAVD